MKLRLPIVVFACGTAGGVAAAEPAAEPKPAAPAPEAQADAFQPYRGVLVADEARGKVVVDVAGGTLEVADGTAVEVIGDDDEDFLTLERCIGEPERDLSGDNAIRHLCVRLPGQVRRTGMVEASFLRPDASAAQAVDPALPGWTTWTQWTGLGDCPHYDSWLMGPRGARRRLPNVHAVNAIVQGERVFFDLLGQVCVASRAQPLEMACEHGASPAIAPDGTVWFRANLVQGLQFDRAKPGKVRRDTSVYRFVLGESELVWTTSDRVLDYGGYECQQDFSRPLPLRFSRDGKRALVDGRWRKVPPLPKPKPAAWTP